MSSPRAFYDGFARKLLGDYVTGNARMERALGFALTSLPAGQIDVLDVGCGIGWSSSEIARNRAAAMIRGVDLSPRLVAMADALFGAEPRVGFEVGDFIEGRFKGQFDAIVLLDVYEHFPASERPVVHERLGALLKRDGCVILTVPTPRASAVPQR